MRIILYVAILAYLVALFILTFNPHGLEQTLFNGQQPPYHWVQADMRANTPGSVDEKYIGANGKMCATVYRYGSDASWTVFGFGFHGDYDTRGEAEAVAEKECR